MFVKNERCSQVVHPNCMIRRGKGIERARSFLYATLSARANTPITHTRLLSRLACRVREEVIVVVVRDGRHVRRGETSIMFIMNDETLKS